MEHDRMPPVAGAGSYQAAKQAVLLGRIAYRQADDCECRQVVTVTHGEERALCGRLVELTGSAERGMCEVRRDVCEACCRLVPPSPSGVNPAMASLLYRAASKILERGGIAGCDPAKASALRQLAEDHLECVFPDEEEPPALAGSWRTGGPRQGATSPQPPLDRLIPVPARRCGPEVKTWAVGVTTSPRKEPTIDTCLDSLIRAGWERPWLFVDGGTRLAGHQGHLPVTYREESAGAWPNFYLALQELLMRQPDADAFLLAQDDALFYDGENIRQYLESSLWPDDHAAVVSLYCPDPYTRRQPGWYELDGTWVWGALAFIFSNAAARRLAADGAVFSHRWTGHRRDAQVDVVVGAWAQRQAGNVYYPVPSLLQHIGQSSTLWPAGRAAGKRRASWLVGDSPPCTSAALGTPQQPAEPWLAHNSVSLSKLAVVTCGFDLQGSQRWLENYTRFREGMRAHGIELYTVEGIMRGEAPTLPVGDRTLQYTLEATLWHKERLLNLGIAALPSDVDAVGWFDADVLFRRDGLAQAILAALERSPVIQPWRCCEWLDADGNFVPWGGRNRWVTSLAAKNWERAPNRKVTSPRSGHPGLAWAARRETIRAMGGLFDRHPLGGGDAMMAIAFWGDWQAPYLDQYNDAMRRSLYDWGQGAFAVVQGNVGFVDAAVSHLWHGSLRGRKYPERNRTISRLGIDPVRHLQPTSNGTWKWSGDTPGAIVRYAGDYFAGRRQDTELRA